MGHGSYDHAAGSGKGEQEYESTPPRGRLPGRRRRMDLNEELEHVKA